MNNYRKPKRQLYRGIFWITNNESFIDFALTFQIPCDRNGKICDDFEMDKALCSENSNDYNHKKVWSTLPKYITENKPYNYFPRGRVEIRNGKALIFASVHLSADILLKWAIKTFNLSAENGITDIKVIADGSQHYKCYLDEK